MNRVRGGGGQLAQEEHEKHAAGQLEDAGTSEEAKRFLEDKEQGLAALNASHDAHIAVIDKWEEQVVARERKDAAAFLDQAKADSVARDRRRILEIVDITSMYNEEIVVLTDFERTH